MIQRGRKGRVAIGLVAFLVLGAFVACTPDQIDAFCKNFHCGKYATTTTSVVTTTTATSSTTTATTTTTFGTTTTTVVVNAPGTIRSINVSGYSPTDQFITNPATQAIIAAHHVPYLRVPFRDGWTAAQYQAQFQAVKNAGAVPLATIHGACLAAGQEAISDAYLSLADQVFPTGNYYVEYGNEEDRGGCSGGVSVSAAQYTTGWNRDIPLLKAAHPRALFGGSATAGLDTTFTKTWLQAADPRPDFVSWHIYPCSTTTDEPTCLGKATTSFANDANAMRSAMSSVGYGATPLWLTEWNMDFASDTKYSDGPFMAQWTAAALNEFANLSNAGTLQAAFQYSMTNHGTGTNGACSNFELICADNTFSAEGATFFAGAN